MGEGGRDIAAIAMNRRFLGAPDAVAAPGLLAKLPNSRGWDHGSKKRIREEKPL
jgi:hypothetical protein